MKKILLVITVLAALCPVSMSANAAGPGNQTYAAFQYALGSYGETGVEDVKPTAVVGRLGTYFTDYFSLEGRFGFGLQDDSINVLGVEVATELDTLIGVYGVGHLSLSETSSVYGLVGFTRIETTTSAPGYSVSDDDSGLSLGLGAGIGVGEGIALNLEYTLYLDKSEFDFSAIGVGIAFEL